MKVSTAELPRHLRQQLQPIYWVCGDEPLQLSEACDAIRAAARAQGFSEREVMHLEPGFKWDNLLAASATLSLFSDKRLIELRLGGGKLDENGRESLVAYAQHASTDSCLLISSDKLDQATFKTKWFSAIEQAGVVIQVWPVERAQLPQWLLQRMSAKGLQAEPEVAELLAERSEGNLLSAVQEIDKLALLLMDQVLDRESVLQAVADSARYDPFVLIDTALDGDPVRVHRILQGLKEEGVVPVQVVWALARELRALVAMSEELASGQPMEQVLRQQRVWDKRKSVIRKALARHNGARWQAMLRLTARIDRLAKGQAAGNAWEELLQLLLMVAGLRLFRAQQPA